MISLTIASYSLAAAVAAILVWKIAAFIISCNKSYLPNLPGPPSPSWIYGNTVEIFEAETATKYEGWVKQYGHVFKFKDMLNHDVLYTMDTRALTHILNHSNDYQKPAVVRAGLSRIVGKGLLTVEGEQHRQQRRIMNPAFGPAQIRELTEIFFEKAILLRDYWNETISVNGEPSRIEILSGLTKMTLDVIGLAGFNYHFNSLNPNGKPNELQKAFSVIFGLSSAKPSIIRHVINFFPFGRLIPHKGIRRVVRAKETMDRIGMEIIKERKAELLRATTGEKIDGKLEELQGRDLLTLLLKANVAADIPESQRLSDEDVLAQVPTFTVAGHETSSNATSWCLYALARDPRIQKKLREEIWSVGSESPSMDELQALPYLDAVLRETMRIHSPVPFSIREAVKDDIIPLNAPFTDVNGQVHDSIHIKAGALIEIPILPFNRSKELWGEDAFEFKPERWESIPEAVHTIPGVWGNIMSFLGGPRSCIGYRFSVVEMKALIFTLIRAFEFELAVPADEIVRQSSNVQRPLVRSEKEKGGQLPMLIRPYRGV